MEVTDTIVVDGITYYSAHYIEELLPEPKAPKHTNNAQNSYNVGWNDYRQQMRNNIKKGRL